MRTLRFYVPLEFSVGDVIQAPENTARHISQVLRLRIEDEVTLFNGDDHEYGASIVDIKKKNVSLKILNKTENSKESTTKIHLIQAVSKGDRMDWVIQKAVELGVSSIQPVTSNRTNVNLSADRSEKKVQHWNGVIASACEQCGRNSLPELHPVCSLDAVVNSLIASPSLNKIILNPRSTLKLQSTEFPSLPFILSVGPEGGFDDTEVAFLESAGFVSFNLGPRILRTETAAISCITLLQALEGDL